MTQQDLADLYFNSMKVRLILIKIIIKVIIYALFQFHEGSINTFKSVTLPTLGQGFQFHEGSINTVLEYHLEMKYQHFNSMKVRLIPGGSAGSASSSLFQFHEGSINTQHQQ